MRKPVCVTVKLASVGITVQVSVCDKYPLADNIYIIIIL